MTKLSETPPLRIVQVNKINQVVIHINDPLLPKKENKKVRQELYLLKLFGQLELLLEKINRLELWKSKGSLASTDSILKNLHEQVLIIRADIKQQPETLQLKVRDDKSLYPKATKFVFIDEPYYSATAGEQYQLDHLEQLYATACRLYHDLNLPDHKYIVYQLALLYQCINRQGVPFISYKGRIEQRFSEMVSLSKTSDTVHLDSDQTAWLQSLTLDIIMQVTDYASVIKCSDIFNYISQNLVEL